MFDEFNQQFHFDLNVLTNDRKSILDIAREQGHDYFWTHVNSLINNDNQQPKFCSSKDQTQAHNQASVLVNETQSSVEMMKSLQLPENEELIRLLTCPLSGKLLEVPVMAADGYTYEKEKILDWFKTSDKSPVTKEALLNKELKLNITIENIIKAVGSKKKSLTTPATYYKMQTDDVFVELSKTSVSTFDEMKGANPETKNDDKLDIGQTIKVP
ncbi:unnamed protein product, partial [Didymodactylos carnosus]